MQSDENVGKVFVDNWSCFHKCIANKQQKECCCDEHKRGKETRVVVSTPEVSEERQRLWLTDQSKRKRETRVFLVPVKAELTPLR